MTVTIEDVFPNINSSLSKIGFLFGAGTSKEAGYPLTNDLTKNVLEKLPEDKISLLTDLLQRKHLKISINDGSPDIETISDIITEYKLINTETNHRKLLELETSIQDLIVDEILSVKNPNLKFHTLFLQALKRLIGARFEPIWIFTPNYDTAIELAGAEAQIPVCNGFLGIFKRYFDLQHMDLIRGRIVQSRFQKRFETFKTPCINLIKLHGSVSWFKSESGIFEDNPFTSKGNPAMIHPRKRKVIDTLEHPFDQLFNYSNRIIGTNCLFLVCCGFSFRDEHINDRLLIPKLKEGRIRIIALFRNEPEHIEHFKEYKSFNYITEDRSFINGKERESGSDIWKFSRFTELLGRKAGLKVDQND